MQEWDKYREVKLQSGELVARIKNKKQKDWIKVCGRLKLRVCPEFGDGSHVPVYKHDCPPEKRECCIVTINKNLHEDVQRDIFKKILRYGQDSNLYDEDDIWKALGVKK